MDVKRLARFDQPGHRVTKDRRNRSRRVGWDYVHVVIDDHSRLAYAEVHPREDATTNHDCLVRALRFYAQLGLDPPDAVMTDNAKVYTSHAFTTLLAATGATHITPPPSTPRWNGKAERFIRTSKTNRPTPTPGPTQPPETAACNHSSATTTKADPTTASDTSHPKAAFTTYVGRTASAPDATPRPTA